MPTDIEKILEHIAMWAKGYDNHMKWSEEAKLKSDMMRHTDRWRLVSTQQIRDKCHDLCWAVMAPMRPALPAPTTTRS